MNVTFNELVTFPNLISTFEFETFQKVLAIQIEVENINRCTTTISSNAFEGAALG